MHLSAMQISPIDCAILVLYLVGITLFGARFRRGQQNLRDYFLGGRSAPWWAIMCSIVATETSTLTIISTPGIAYGGNLEFLQLVLGYLVARVMLVSFWCRSISRANSIPLISYWRSDLGRE